MHANLRVERRKKVGTLAFSHILYFLYAAPLMGVLRTLTKALLSVNPLIENYM